MEHQRRRSVARSKRAQHFVSVHQARVQEARNEAHGRVPLTPDQVVMRPVRVRDTKLPA